MKNSIWVAADADGEIWDYMVEKPTLDATKRYCNGSSTANRNVYNLNLKPLEIAEVIIDTEAQTYEVKRQREIGWYLVECKEIEDDGLIFAAHWNGKNWNPVRNKEKWRRGTTWKGLAENEVTIISEKLPDNEYLRGLE